MNLTLTFTPGTPALEALRERMRRPMMQAVGLGVQVRLRAHFMERNAQPNKKGWPRSNFWRRRIAETTLLSEFTENSATVGIADPAMAQKIYGGTIVPKEAKYLSLPARAEAAGKRPGLFSDLQFIPLKRGDLAGMLVKKDDKTGPYFFLFKKVTQDADPDALPKPADLERAANEAAQDFLNLAAARERAV